MSRTPFSYPPKPASGRSVLRGLALLIFCVGLLLAPALPAVPLSHAFNVSAETPRNTLQIGIFSYRPEKVLRPMLQPLAEYLEQHLPKHNVVLHFLDQKEMVEAVGNNLLDVVFTNPVHFVNLRLTGALSGAIATQVTLEQGHPTAKLGGAIIRRQDRTDITTLKDLEGKTVAIPGKQDLGGYTAPAAWLRQNGIDLDTVTFLELGNPHDNVIQAVLSGTADVGFVRTGVLEAIRKEGEDHAASVAVVSPIDWPGFTFQVSTPLYPEWAVATLNHVDHDTSRRLSAALLALEPDDPAAAAAGIYGFAIPKDYSVVEKAMVDLRVPPFDQAPVVTLEAFVRQNLAAVLFFLTLTTASGIFFLRVAWLNHRLSAVNKALQATSTERDDLVQRLTEVANNVPGALYQYRLRPDGSSHFPFASERIHDVYGCSAESVSADATVVFSRIHPDDFRHLQRTIDESARRFTQWNATYRVNHPTKGERWIEGRATPSRQPDGSITWHGYLADITEEHLNRERIQLAARVVAASHEGILILDQNLQIIEVNPAFTRITGYDLDTIKGRSPILLALDAGAPPFSRNFQQLLEDGGQWRGETWFCNKEGVAIPVMLSIAPVANADQDFNHFVMLFSDITAIKKQEEELQRLAHYDALTGIPNRRLLIDRLRQATALTRRTGKPLAICMLDLDGFKPINDTLGHEAGDRLLVEIARRLKSVIRGEDTVARLGGDEFTLILVNPTGTALFERILHAVKQPVALDEGIVNVSASLGVVYFEAGMDADDDQLLRMADQALYESKKQGRNRFTIFGSPDAY